LISPTSTGFSEGNITVSLLPSPSKIQQQLDCRKLLKHAETVGTLCPTGGPGIWEMRKENQIEAAKYASSSDEHRTKPSNMGS